MFKDSRGISHYSFAESCPDQMLDWDYDKNTVDPYSLPKTSKEVCYFKCHICGYEWKSGIYRISYSRSKCLYCYGKQTPKIGISDLFTLRPDLKDDWDWSKNTKDPKCLGINSHYFAHWKCHVCGHEWCCRLDTRSRNGSGCPVCAHIGGTSCAEYLIYLLLKDKGAENRKRLLGYEYDVVFTNKIIEYDGIVWHEDTEDRDEDKVATAQSNGYSVYIIKERNDSHNNYTMRGNIAFMPKLELKTFAFYKEVLVFLVKEWSIVGKDFVPSESFISMSYLELRSKISRPDFKKSIRYDLDKTIWSWSLRNGVVNPELVYANNNVYVWVTCDNGHDIPMRGDTIYKYGCRICNCTKVGITSISNMILLMHFRQLFREENVGEFKMGVNVGSIAFSLYSDFYKVGIVFEKSKYLVYDCNTLSKIGEVSINRSVDHNRVVSYLDELYRSFEGIYNSVLG